MDDILSRLEKCTLTQETFTSKLLSQNEALSGALEETRDMLGKMLEVLDASHENAPARRQSLLTVDAGLRMAPLQARRSKVTVNEDSAEVELSFPGAEHEETEAVDVKPSFTEGALRLRGRTSIRGDASTRARKSATAVFAESNPFRGSCRMLAEASHFESFFGLLSLLSAVLIGVEIQMEATDSLSSSFAFVVTQGCICILFAIELSIRALAYGKAFLGFGEGSLSELVKWNIFDSICFVTMVIDIVSEVSGQVNFQGGVMMQGRVFRLFRVLRILRAIRAVRIARAANFAKEFRKMAYALQYSVLTLFWAMLLLAFVMYFFATIFTQSSVDEYRGFITSGSEVPQYAAALRKDFGTIPRSFYSLFKSITGGIDWQELFDPLSNLHWINPFLFILFEGVTTFGVLNVITSVFVESAVASYQHYKDMMIQEKLDKKTTYLEHLRKVFIEIDRDKSGTISMEEMEGLLYDKDLSQYVESMEINPDDARTLFKLLDKDDSGCIDINEFLSGCLKIKGEAKSFDIHCLIYENSRIVHKWNQFMDYLDTGLSANIQKMLQETLASHAVGGARRHASMTPSASARQKTRSLSQLVEM
eukprot:TRINITY_DN23713_c0_g1_i1.p1 TRINITY_DN23713_c0_g1~~TRINITY_DN23713_c0_g1_i1.p1  ORF type:complete len:592 (-),score=94.03 TRINITY_DN23713_c0_g1_i1:52-1827(-)